MHRCDKIINHPLYKEYLQLNIQQEQDRRFCKHDMNHFLDTARIGYILILEQNLDIKKYIIYAASLVHDIARCKESEEVHHDEASARFAERILPECGFTADETALIAEAVRAHRLPSGDRSTLGGVLYTADKLSRRCFECDAYDECNWSKEKKNNCIYF